MMLVINLVGLTFGLTVFLLIAQYVRSEFSYDSQHANADRIHVIEFHARISEQEMLAPIVSAVIPEDLSREITDIESYTRLSLVDDTRPMRAGGVSFLERGLGVVDSTFFRIFDGYEVIQGDRETVLTQPNSVVLSEEAAHRYFG